MGKRRMLSADVIGSRRFTHMPQEAQLLYVQLNGAADDDGFVTNPEMICFGLRFDASTLEILKKNGYMIEFPEGIAVLVHWNVNNQIRKDRYQETFYRSEKEMLELDAYGMYHLKDTGADTGADTNTDTSCDKAESKAAAAAQTERKNGETGTAPKEHNAVTAVSSAADTQYNTGKERINQYNIREEREKTAQPEKHPHGEYQNVFLTDLEFQKLKETYPNWQRMIENLSSKIRIHGYEYQDHFAVLKKWAQEDKNKPSDKNKPTDIPAPSSEEKKETYASSPYDFEAIERKAFLNVHKILEEEDEPLEQKPDTMYDDFGF